LKDGRYYIGSTGDIERRLKEHNSGKTKSLLHRRPLELVHIEAFDSMDEAKAREKQIKSYQGGAAFKSLMTGSSSR